VLLFFNYSGRVLISGGFDCGLCVWDLVSGKPTHELTPVLRGNDDAAYATTDIDWPLSVDSIMFVDFLPNQHGKKKTYKPPDRHSSDTCQPYDPHVIRNLGTK
jgi:WD40 repeat protein